MFGANLIINDRLNVSEGKDAFSFKRLGMQGVGIDNRETIIDIDKPIIIDTLYWVSGHHLSTKISLNILGGEVGWLDPSGTKTTNYIGPRDVTAGVLGEYLNVVTYNEKAGVYRFNLKRPIYCPKGVRIIAENTGSEQYLNGVHVKGRYL